MQSLGVGASVQRRNSNSASDRLSGDLVGAEESEEENSEHRRTDEHVQLVAFYGETNQSKDHSRDWCCDQQQDSKLDDRGRIGCSDTVDHSSDVAQVLRFAREYPVIRSLGMMGTDIENASGEHHKGGQEHSDLEQAAHDDFHAPVVEVSIVFRIESGLL